MIGNEREGLIFLVIIATALVVAGLVWAMRVAYDKTFRQTFPILAAPPIPRRRHRDDPRGPIPTAGGTLAKIAGTYSGSYGPEGPEDWRKRLAREYLEQERRTTIR